MAVTKKKSRNDANLKAILEAMEKYHDENTTASIKAYRRGPFLIRARILNPQFKGLSIGERQKSVWKYFETLSDETVNDLGQLLLLTPSEAKESYANRVFEHPELLDD